MFRFKHLSVYLQLLIDCLIYSVLTTGDTPVITLPFEYLMMAHTSFYEYFKIGFKSIPHYALNIVIDYILISLTAALSYTLVFIFSFIIEKKSAFIRRTEEKTL